MNSPINSRSYAQFIKAMNANPKVGGLTFGRPPVNDHAVLDVTDIFWRTNGPNALTLYLKSDEGALHNIAAFDPEIVHQALGFAHAAVAAELIDHFFG